MFSGVVGTRLLTLLLLIFCHMHSCHSTFSLASTVMSFFFFFKINPQKGAAKNNICLTLLHLEVWAGNWSNWCFNKCTSSTASHLTFNICLSQPCKLHFLMENKDFLYVCRCDGTLHYVAAHICNTCAPPVQPKCSPICSSICIAACLLLYSLPVAGDSRKVVIIQIILAAPNTSNCPNENHLSASIRTNCHARGQQLIDALE